MTQIRTDWTREEIAGLFDLPFTELLFRAATVHREFHPPEQVQLCTLLSIKTGGCPEDCGYCSQSVKADSGVEATKLMDVRAVLQSAAQAKDAGQPALLHGRGLAQSQGPRHARDRRDREGCARDGSRNLHDAGHADAEAGGDAQAKRGSTTTITISTRPGILRACDHQPQVRGPARHAQNVRDAGINVCSGGIVGMGETREDRVGFVHTLATLDAHPESVPVNALVPVKGTVLGDMLADTPLAKIDDIEFVRTVAVARICMPMSMVRLSAGRESMSEATQALCFLAGANSIFTGDKLLTAPNAGDDSDGALFAKLGLTPLAGEEPMRTRPVMEPTE